MNECTKEELEALFGLSQGYLSKPKAMLSRRVQAGLKLVAELDKARTQARSFARYLALWDEHFPGVTGEDDETLLRAYNERITRLKAQQK